MTVQTNSKMGSIFDEDVGTCADINDIMFLKSNININNNTDIGNAIFKVIVHNITSCSDYQFMNVVMKSELCDYMKPCKLVDDSVTSHNSCIVSCPCDGNCDITIVLYSRTKTD